MEQQFDFAGEVVWRPSRTIVEKSNLTRFMRRHGIASLDALQKKSTDDIEWFWNAVIEDLGIHFETPYSKIVDLSKGVQWPRWCVDGRMNIVATMLDCRAGTAVDQCGRWFMNPKKVRGAN